MAVCPVCGCKTDALDFVNGSIGGLQKSVCSFCDRQLKAFDSDEVSDAQLKWLKAVITKDVPERDDTVSDALKSIYEKTGSIIEDVSVVDEVPEQKAYNATPKKTVVVNNEKELLIAELSARVDSLEKTVIDMKRRQLIKTICEIAIPVILGIIVMIVFFSSGFYRTLSDLYGSFG